MPKIEGRPTGRIVIEDCASCVIYVPPTPACPHGLAWRPSRWETPTIPAEAPPERVKALQDFIASVCAEAACEATEYQPHKGERIVLQAPRDVEWRAGLDDRLNACAGDPTKQIRLAYELLPDVVKAWTWTGIDGAALPLPTDDDALAKIRANTEGREALWIIEVLSSGGDPVAVAVEAGNGDAASPSI